MAAENLRKRMEYGRTPNNQPTKKKLSWEVQKSRYNPDEIYQNSELISGPEQTDIRDSSLSSFDSYQVKKRNVPVRHSIDADRNAIDRFRYENTRKSHDLSQNRPKKLQTNAPNLSLEYFEAQDRDVDFKFVA